MLIRVIVKEDFVIVRKQLVRINVGELARLADLRIKLGEKITPSQKIIRRLQWAKKIVQYA